MHAASSFFSRPAVGLALLLAGWGAAKVGWEQRLRAQQDAMRYHGVTMTRELRDQVGQGMVIALLSGFRGLAADFAWLGVTDAWQNEQWSRVKSRVELATTLQPRSILFWEMGGWHLAWNAAVSKRNDRREPLEIRRIKEERFWIDAGRDLYLRGIENNPEKPALYMQMAFLYEQKKKDYRQAAHYYQLATEQPGVPVYAYRFVGYNLEKAGADREAYAYWKSLWARPGPKTEGQWRWEKVEERIRFLEKKLAIPQQKRIFPDR